MRKGKMKMNKKGLAALSANPLYRARRVQAICYASVLLNITLLACLAGVMLCR